MSGPDSVRRELATMHGAGIIDPETLRRALSYLEKNEDTVRAWLDSAMSITEACDLLVDLAGR